MAEQMPEHTALFCADFAENICCPMTPNEDYTVPCGRGGDETRHGLVSHMDLMTPSSKKLRTVRQGRKLHPTWTSRKRRRDRKACEPGPCCKRCNEHPGAWQPMAS